MRTEITRAAVVCLLLLAVAAGACLPPSNIEGVAFTANETVNWAALEQFGSDGVEFFKDGESPQVSYRYISHYSNKAMAYVGNVGLSYLSDISVNCMGIILNPAEIPDSIEEYGKIDTSIFNFTEAVKVELEWLAANGIIELSTDDIEQIYGSLSKVSNGSMQYWTCCESVLGYNSWYDYDEQAGVWGAGAGVDGVKAVRDVSGVYGGCSVIPMTFELPPAVMEGGSGTIGPRGGRSPAISLVRGSWMLSIEIAEYVSAPASVTFRNAAGRFVMRADIAGGVQRAVIDTRSMHLCAGWYHIDIDSPALRARESFLLVP